MTATSYFYSYLRSSAYKITQQLRLFYRLLTKVLLVTSFDMQGRECLEVAKVLFIWLPWVRFSTQAGLGIERGDLTMLIELSEA